MASEFTTARNITAELRQLKVGETVMFPCEQRSSLLTIAARIKKNNARIGWNYAVVEDKSTFNTGIRRTN